MNRARGIYLVIGFLLVFLIVNIGQATWLLTPPLTRRYVVQPGQTLPDIASLYRVHEQEILQANGLRPGSLLQSGQVLAIPLSPLAPLLDWKVQLPGLCGTLAGVLLSFWLCGLAGLLPPGARGRILGVSLLVALISYVTVQTSSREVWGVVTPLFMLTAIKDGFAWGALLPLLAKALGFGPGLTWT